MLLVLEDVTVSAVSKQPAWKRHPSASVLNLGAHRPPSRPYPGRVMQKGGGVQPCAVACVLLTRVGEWRSQVALSRLLSGGGLPGSVVQQIHHPDAHPTPAPRSDLLKHWV